MSKFMVKATALFFIGLLAISEVATAQPASPVATLLTRAKTALNDLRYSEADSLARLVMLLGDVVPRDQRVLALQIAAAARYPDEKQFQRADSARSALRALVAMGYTAAIPFDLSWSGLDSLFAGVGGAVVTQSGIGTQPAAIAGAGPTRGETEAWLSTRIPQFAGVSWADTAGSHTTMFTEIVTRVEVQQCQMVYRIQRRYQESGARRPVRPVRSDSSFSFSLSRMNPATLEVLRSDVLSRAMGQEAYAAKPTPIAVLRVFETGADRNAPNARKIDLVFARDQNANRTRVALGHLIQLCQKEPF
jgi:hypothetical protein